MSFANAISIKEIDKLLLLKSLWNFAACTPGSKSDAEWDEKAASKWLEDGCVQTNVNGRQVAVDMSGEYLQYAHVYDSVNGVSSGVCSSIVETVRLSGFEFMLTTAMVWDTIRSAFDANVPFTYTKLHGSKPGVFVRCGLVGGKEYRVTFDTRDASVSLSIRYWEVNGYIKCVYSHEIDYSLKFKRTLACCNRVRSERLSRRVYKNSAGIATAAANAVLI